MTNDPIDPHPSPAHESPATPVGAGRSALPASPAEHEAVPDARWDAGDMGCGELVLELRMRVARLGPGAVLEVIARDAGAPADLPAWCRMTGNALLSAAHPVYLIRRGA